MTDITLATAPAILRQIADLLEAQTTTTTTAAPKPVETIRFPTGPITSRLPWGAHPSGIQWETIARWEPMFTDAVERAGASFHPLLLACFAIIETGGQHYTTRRTIGTPEQVVRGKSDNRAIGILQIRADLHDPVQDWDSLEPEGNILLGATLLNRWIKETGSWEAAVTQKWHPGTDPSSGVDENAYVQAVRALIAEAKGETTTTAAPGQIIFGRVPMPANYQPRYIAPDGINSAFSWTDARRPRGIVLHRMLGTLVGTDGYFRNEARNRALTDFGIGQGQVYRWTRPGAAIAPWASGASSTAHSVASGDGIAFVNRYGWRQNADCESIEIEGRQYTSPVPTADYQRLVELVAWRADAWLRVPWDVWPKNTDGVHALFWHNEFQNEKNCPGEVVMELTDQLIWDVRARLKQYQVQS